MRNYLRPYVWQLAVMLVAACVASGSAIVIPLLTKSVIDSAIAHGNRRLLILLSLAALGLGATQAILNFIRRWIQAGAVTGMEQAIRDDLYAHLQRLDTAFHSEWQSGQLLSRATTDLSTIRRFAGFGIVFAITNMVQFAVVVALLVSLNWVLGLLTGAVFLPVMAVSTWFERRYTVLSRSAQDQQGDLATYVEEAATGLGVIKALGRRVEFAHTHGASATRVYRTQVAKARLRGNFWASLELIPNIIIGMIVLFGALAVSHHTLTLGGLVAFITLTLQLVWPIEAVGYILASGQEAATAAQRVYEILDSQPAISDRPAVSAAVTGALSAATLPRPRPAVETAVLRRQHPARLVFDGVRFSYPQASQPVLRSVSLTVEPGKTLALVGATGSGKTTLLQLVPRLADPEAGSITLDGVDVGDMPLVRLRARVGCTFEEPSLFSVSVRENVTLGVSGASAAEIEQALATAHADFVYELPWGLDTRIGEQGMSLSGGQRQRLALARAILAGPQVLVLDDPLSALDVRTEEKVTLALRQVLAGTTALIVAHRPSTVLLADSVALLADGVIAAQGTHADLLATDARYRALMSGTHPAPASQRAAAPPGLTSTPRAEGRGAAWTEERPREPQGRGAVWTEERPREPQGRGAVWTEEREASAASAGATREDGASGRPGGERAGRASAGATREDGALRHPEASGVSRVLPGGPEASGTSSDEGAQAVAR
ncbi:MAG TPA: ABC transporter transmembrane domain-containing protein [Streptosporangiaceae bacterium]|nr:ABC transporter transmembrane domain-containing protein [Streptosporangiaceae bacterium]